MLGELGLAALAVAAFGAAAAAFRRGAAADRALRRDVLADCVATLEDAAIAPDAAGYGALKGWFEGVEAALRPMVDTLAFRRLPQLWLVVTVRTPTGADATIDALRRPSGVEFYAAGDALPKSFPPPPSWPQDTGVRGSAGAAATLAALEAALAGPLADDRVKEITVAPSGVRLVRQLRQGRRGAYLVFRDSRFPDPRATPEEVRAALAQALQIARAARARNRPSGSGPADATVAAA